MDTDVLRRDAREVWTALEDEFGESLRVVNRYHLNSFETIMRDDVRSHYTEAEDREIVDQAIINQLNTRKLDESFKAGEFQSFIEAFEEVWVVIWPDNSNTKSGFLVSIDRDPHTSITHTETAIQYLNDRDSTPPE